MRPVLIYAPAYHHMSAGVRACYQLCAELRQRGIDAVIRPTHGSWRPSPYDAPPVQVLNQRQIGESICIFPEYIVDTEVKTPRAIKWWLQKPEIKLPLKGPIYVWSNAMGNYPRLMLDVLDTNLFKPSQMNRVAVAYYVGKGRKDDKFLPDGAVEITREYPKQREELALLLGQLDHLVCFDGYSALSCEAALMGTPVLMPTVDKSLRKLNEGHEFQINISHGFAYSPEELPMAKANVGSFYNFYQSLKPVFKNDLDSFTEMILTKW